MNEKEEQIRLMEDVFLSASEQASDTVYERFISGEITQDEMQNIYKHLAQWLRESQKLLEIVT